MDNTITYNDREFVLQEPTTDVVLRILNTVGGVAIRAESTVKRVIEEPSNRALMLGLLSVLDEADLVRLGSAVLQFEDDREGRKWLKQEGIRVAPLIKAFFVNLSLSEDLVEAIKSFFAGIEQTTAVLNALTTPNLETETTTEEDTG